MRCFFRPENTGIINDVWHAFKLDAVRLERQLG